MQNQTNFHWNSDTIEYFKELYAINENDYYRKIEEFVKYECDLEDGETHQDLMVYKEITELERLRDESYSN